MSSRLIWCRHTFEFFEDPTTSGGYLDSSNNCIECGLPVDEHLKQNSNNLIL